MNIENGLNFPLNMLETFSYFITSGHRILNLPNWACKFRICKPKLCMTNKNNQFVFCYVLRVSLGTCISPS